MQTFELEHVDEEVRRQQEDEERQQDQRESIDDRENRMQENLRRLQSLGRHTHTHRHQQERGLGPLRSQLYMDLTRQDALQRSLMGLDHCGERYREDGSHRNVDIDNY